MATSDRRLSLANRLLSTVVLSMTVSAVGCSVNTGGQTLPSGYYLSDDVQYFAPGPEFPLQNEAAAQQLRKAEAEAQRAAKR